MAIIARLTTCSQCNNKFIKQHKSQRFCSHDCYSKSMIGAKIKNSGQFSRGQSPWNKGTRKKFTCDQCGKTFQPKTHGVSYKYCSTNCFHKARTGTPLLSRRKPIEIRPCVVCKKSFRVPVKNRNKKVCDRVCAGKLKSIKSFEKYKDPKYIEKRIEKNKKREADRVERVVFYSTVRKVVLKRDNYTCAICGKKGVDLHVDHIKSWATHKDLRFDADNCRTMCKPCHYEKTYHKKMENIHSAWGRNLCGRVSK